jgi:type VI secretion system protein VasL
MLKERAAGSPKLEGWQQTRMDLRSFAELLVQREQAKSGFTLSYIKTIIYQAERTLNQETPLEYVLTQQARSTGKNNDMLENRLMKGWMGY